MEKPAINEMLRTDFLLPLFSNPVFKQTRKIDLNEGSP